MARSRTVVQVNTFQGDGVGGLHPSAVALTITQSGQAGITIAGVEQQVSVVQSMVVGEGDGVGRYVDLPTTGGWVEVQLHEAGQYVVNRVGQRGYCHSDIVCAVLLGSCQFEVIVIKPDDIVGLASYQTGDRGACFTGIDDLIACYEAVHIGKIDRVGRIDNGTDIEAARIVAGEEWILRYCRLDIDRRAVQCILFAGSQQQYLVITSGDHIVNLPLRQATDGIDVVVIDDGLAVAEAMRSDEADRIVGVVHIADGEINLAINALQEVLGTGARRKQRNSSTTTVEEPNRVVIHLDDAVLRSVSQTDGCRTTLRINDEVFSFELMWMGKGDRIGDTINITE